MQNVYWGTFDRLPDGQETHVSQVFASRISAGEKRLSNDEPIRGSRRDWPHLPAPLCPSLPISPVSLRVKVEVPLPERTVCV